MLDFQGCKICGIGAFRRTKRWEAHIWDEKKQVYLGGFDVEEHAGKLDPNLNIAQKCQPGCSKTRSICGLPGKAHDVMALKCRGSSSALNFGLEEYEEMLTMLPQISKVHKRLPLCQWHRNSSPDLPFASLALPASNHTSLKVEHYIIPERGWPEWKDDENGTK